MKTLIQTPEEYYNDLLDEKDAQIMERDATIELKNETIISQAREIVALEEKMKEGRDVILTGLKMIEEMLKLEVDS